MDHPYKITLLLKIDDVDEYGNINDLIDYHGDNIKPKKTKLSKKFKEETTQYPTT